MLPRVFILIFCIPVFGSVAQDPLYKNARLSPEVRTRDLLEHMTSDEKEGQLLCLMGWEMYTKTDGSVSTSTTFQKLVDSLRTGAFWGVYRAAQYAGVLFTASYPGQEGGNSIADVLPDVVNPSGKLPVSVLRSVGQLSVYCNKQHPKENDYVEIPAIPFRLQLELYFLCVPWPGHYFTVKCSGWRTPESLS